MTAWLGDVVPLTVGSITPNGYYPAAEPWPTFPATYTVVTAATECSGNAHVFPCPHCDKCKCGKATVAR